MDQFSHIEFEEFLKDEENQYCFDCGNRINYFREKTSSMGIS